MKKIVCFLIALTLFYSCEMNVAGICESETDSIDKSADDETELETVVIEEYGDSGATFSLTLSSRAEQVSLYTLTNGSEDYTATDLGRTGVTTNEDGTYTYESTNTEGYEEGDVISAYFYTMSRFSGEEYYPGPDANSYTSYTYGSETDTVDASDSDDDSGILFSELTDTSDWTDETHGKLDTDEIIENLDMVFDMDAVQSIRIVIEPENWEYMNEELEELSAQVSGDNFTDVDDPSFVPCEFFYEDTEWYKVGIRFKGNSSLYEADCSKLPFKLDFDEFEDEYESIDNQRFYGFKQLNLKNNYNDSTEMREVVADQIFRDYGLVEAHSSFYTLYLNVDGSDDEANDIYYGLYSLVEEVDDTVIETQYDDDDGNLYKPEDDAATFAEGTYDEDEYGLKTDDDESYEDILELYEAINDSSRYYDTDTWMTNLEAILDVDTFLKWLAVNTVMQNWDTYGVMPHNFYLYNNPDTGTFEWIPWDNNEAMQDIELCLDISMEEVDDSWPLIRYIMDVDSYYATYKEYCGDFADTIFNDSYMTPLFEEYRDLIGDYVAAEGDDYTFTSEREFYQSVEEIIEHTDERNQVAQNFSSAF
ncbi:MAG: CotH kinase family protein [Spirochaetales bacterium]|nr:CotH kinase family protein [Spirochaetales bacterium]